MPGKSIPKPQERSEFNPAMGDDWLSWLAGELGPADRKALCENGELVLVDGDPVLVAPISAATFDALAAFECEGEDLEDFHEDYCPSDKEPSLAGTHPRFPDEIDAEHDIAEAG